MTINLEFTLERKDFEEGMRVYNQSQIYLKIIGIFSVFAFVGTMISLVLLALYYFIINDIEMVQFLLKTILIFSGFGFFCIPSFGQKAMTFFMWKVAPFLKEPVVVEIGESGFSYKNAVMKSEIEWSSIQKVIESQTVFFILHKLKAYYTLPKRSFTEENLNEFKQILATHLVQIERR